MLAGFLLWLLGAGLAMLPGLPLMAGQAGAAFARAGGWAFAIGLERNMGNDGQGRLYEGPPNQKL